VSREVGQEMADLADTDKEIANEVTGTNDTDLTKGETPAQKQADDETRSPEEEGGEDPNPEK
jgi:hypothetical protein